MAIIPDLSEILPLLKEIAKPYELGIQLKIDVAELDTIVINHRGDIGRQKAEVIKYWQRNSPDPSWTALAKAVERMGGHAGLVRRLLREQTSLKSHYLDASICRSRLPSFDVEADVSNYASISVTSSLGICLERCENRNVLLLGKMGHGKSTLGNKILSYDGCFKINNQKRSQTRDGSATLWSASQHKNYEVVLYDHDGLLEGDSSINTLSSKLPRDLNLVIFVLKCGRSFDEDEREILKSVVSEWHISRISALVLTHCEHISEEEREEMIKQFKKKNPSVAELLGKGVLAVGFPDNSHIQLGSELSKSVEDDKKKVRRLIYSCDQKVNIPKTEKALQRQWRRVRESFSGSLHHGEDFVPQWQQSIESSYYFQHLQNESRRTSRCTIL